MSPQAVDSKAREFVDPEEVRAEIAQHGFMIRVACGYSDGVYLYTVGLTAVDHPELFVRAIPGIADGVDEGPLDEATREDLIAAGGIQAEVRRLRGLAQQAVMEAAQGGQRLGPGRTLMVDAGVAGLVLPVSFETMPEDPVRPMRSCHDLYGDGFTVLVLVNLAHDDDSSV